jgi:Putative regulator of cell autolysis
MSSGPPTGILNEYIGLFAGTEIFVFVFMEIVTKIDAIQRVIFNKALLRDYLLFLVLFGFFSIFGTYIGIPREYGAICNIRDLAPIVAGFVAGPYMGVGVGLVGGIDRFWIGGTASVACSIATILAGLLAGILRETLFSKKIPDILPAMGCALCLEILHGLLILGLVHPFSVALTVVRENIPSMAIANTLGVGISIIIIHSRMETCAGPCGTHSHHTPRGVASPEIAGDHPSRLVRARQLYRQITTGIRRRISTVKRPGPVSWRLHPARRHPARRRSW